MIRNTPHGIINADGTLEVESNDRQLKIVLSRVKVMQDGESVEAFRTSYFVKDGLEWERTIESANYMSSDEFLDAISKSNEFTEAITDIDEQKKEIGGPVVAMYN